MSWWNPDTWWHAVDNTYHRVAGDVKTFVHDAIRSATDAIEQDITDVGNLAAAAINGVWNAVSNVGDLANYAVTWIGGAGSWVGGLINSAIAALTTDVIDPTRAWVGGIQGWIDQAETWASGLINSAIATLTTDVIDPIQAWIDGASDFVGHMIDDAGKAVYRDVIHPIEVDLANAWQRIDHLWQWFEHDAKTAVEGVIKAWDWIAYFAEHPFSELDKVLHQAEDYTTYPALTDLFKIDLEGLESKVSDAIASQFPKGH